MDAYNRGYNRSIEVAGNQVGDAVFFDDKGDQIAQDAGFYAVAYDVNGSKVISFRGADNLDPLSPSTDIFNGWTIGVGFGNTPQARLALEFYEAITGRSAFAGVAAHGGDHVLRGLKEHACRLGEHG